MPRWTEEDTLAMYEEGPIMPRWGDRMDQLEWLVEQEEARSGHQLMLDYYQRQIAASIQIQNLRVQQSPTPENIARAQQELQDEVADYREQIRKARQYNAQSFLEAYQPSRIGSPAPWVDQLAQKRREEAPAFLEEMRSREQVAASSPAPVHHRGSQGMTRGYWLGGTIGRHPGYVSTRRAPSPTPRRAPTA